MRFDDTRPAGRKQLLLPTSEQPITDPCISAWARETLAPLSGASRLTSVGEATIARWAEAGLVRHEQPDRRQGAVYRLDDILTVVRDEAATKTESAAGVKTDCRPDFSVEGSQPFPVVALPAVPENPQAKTPLEKSREHENYRRESTRRNPTD